MAIDTFIKFDGVDGESTNQLHSGEVDVLSWSWGVANAATHAGSGSGVGRPQPADLVITHHYDKASPLLAKKCAQGVHLAQVVLSARKTGQGPTDFLRITLKEVFITSVTPSGNSGDIVESVTMSYGKIDFSYKPQSATGVPAAEVKFGWNVKTSEVT